MRWPSEHGQPAANQQRHALFPARIVVHNEPSRAFNQQINSIRLATGQGDCVYLAMRSIDFSKMIVQTATGSATPIISKGKWDTLLLPIPPLAEQSRIVARVAELRQLCADLRARLTAAGATQSRLADTLAKF